MMSARSHRYSRTCCRFQLVSDTRRLPFLHRSERRKRSRPSFSQAEGLALRHPTIMLFEDIHWSDPTTRELLDLLVDRAPGMRLLALITYRPEFSPAWVGLPHVTLMTLSPLPALAACRTD